MFYYTETVRREPNHRGKPRLVSVLADLPGVLHHGFDGDVPKRGQEAGHHRLWEFASALPTPLPDGVTKLTQTVFDKAIADREAAKPVVEIVEPRPTRKERYDAATTPEEQIALLAEAAGFTNGE